MQKQIIHYCCGSYDQGLHGGVARYDYQIKLVFPYRKFFQGPSQKKQMLNFLKKCKDPIIITDNHLALDIPNNYPLILVHHGSALTHAAREPIWNEYWKNLCCNGQTKMLSYRKPENTVIVSISQFCTDEFNKYFPKIYPLFKNIKIFHPSELNENIYKKKFNKIPIILGNWADKNKGRNQVSILSQKIPFKFIQLNVRIRNGNIQDFNLKKQFIYCKCDIFLLLSMCEGYSYSAIDAMINGLVVMATNTGFFYKDVPEDCFVKLDWRKMNNIPYLIEKLKYGWINRKRLAKNAREWYMKNCRLTDWKNKMHKLVMDFHKEQYSLQ